MIKKRHFIIVMAILLAGLIVGSFLDLQINKAIFSDRNGFGIAMAAFGTLPCYAGLAFLGGGIIGAVIKRKDLHPALRVASIVAGITAYGVSIYLGHKDIPSINGYYNSALKIPMIIASAVVFAGVAFFGYWVCSKNDNKKLWAVIFIMLFVYIVGLIPVSYVIKLFIHRPRYRLLVVSGEVPFHNWWDSFKSYKDYITNPPLEINGFEITKEEFKSFPSGHSGSAAIMMMLLPYLSFFFKKMKGKELLMFYIGFAWTLLMMFSRMLVGAHYLTDTCMGALLLMAVYFITHVFTQHKGWLSYEQQPQEETVTE